MAIKVLSRLGNFIDKEKQPKGLNLSKIIFNILIKHDYNALGDFHHKTLFIGMMHFMDKYNYDIERLKRCGVHYLVPNGLIVPFCAFNVIPEWYRDKIQKEFGVSIEEWENRTGRRIRDDFYIRRVEHLASAKPKMA
ncbi:MAG: radical SAM protein [archaeon]|nr:radical SAM protein [archaeon]